MSLDIVGYRRVFPLAHVLTDIGHPLLDAAGDVVPAVRHAVHYRREVRFALFRVLAGGSCNSRLLCNNFSSNNTEGDAVSVVSPTEIF